MDSLRVSLSRLSSPSSQFPSSSPSGAPGAFRQCLERAAGGATPAAPSTPTAQALDLLAAQQASNLQYLALQQKLSDPHHSVVSNVLKIRHDSAKNAISNLR